MPVYADGGLVEEIEDRLVLPYSEVEPPAAKT
jgi:hypothetical protein